MKQLRKKSYPSISEVTKTEHIGMVKEIFGTITERYDFLNHFLSLRRDVAWRRFAVRRMRFFKTGRLLRTCGRQPNQSPLRWFNFAGWTSGNGCANHTFSLNPPSRKIKNLVDPVKSG